MDNGLDIIAAAEREILRDKEDLIRLKKRYPGYDFVLIPAAVRAGGSNSDLKPLESAALELLNSNPTTEWTSRQTLAGLQVGRFPVPESDDAAMNAVGLALIALTARGLIKRNHEGRGRDPHRYQAIAKANKPEEIVVEV